MATIPTVEEIKTKVSSNAQWAAHAISALYERQTQAEKDTQHTSELNGRGFNGFDSEILSSFAEQIKRGRTLSPKQLAIAFKKLPKYAGQLQDISYRKAGMEPPVPAKKERKHEQPTLMKELDEYNRQWIEMKNDWADQERKQEEAAFMAGM